MRHFDIIKWLWVAGIIYTFLQGYTFYMQRQGEIAVGCSFLCAFCIFQFIRRLHTLKLLPYAITISLSDCKYEMPYPKTITICHYDNGLNVNPTSFHFPDILYLLSSPQNLSNWFLELPASITQDFI